MLETLTEIPYASRPFGWCQYYGDEPGNPDPQHEKCDGLIDGKNPYRCPCRCHRTTRVVRRRKRMT